MRTKTRTFHDFNRSHLAGIARHVDFKINPPRKHRLRHRASGQPREPPTGKLMQNETFTLSDLNILSARPLITALAEVGFQPGTTGYWHRDITFRHPGQLDPRMGTGSATISILRTEASDKTLYDLYVTRTKSLQIQGQDSQANPHGIYIARTHRRKSKMTASYLNLLPYRLKEGSSSP